jgi:hypothetical protein
MNTDLFVNTLPAKTSVLIADFQKDSPSFLKDFYLSGGTALSLQVGHRESEDLDFFCGKNFDPRQIEIALKNFGPLEETELDKNTLNTYLNGVKLQFLGYPYRLIGPLIDWRGISLSSVVDIACTKLQTVGMRGSKKDFIDIYFLLRLHSLDDLFKALEKKYPEIGYNTTHILKSLVYFEDADEQPMPRMRKEVDWETIKAKLVEEVRNFPL